MRFIIIISLLLSTICAIAGERRVTLHFTVRYGEEPLLLEERYYPLSGGDSIVFDVLKYYIGNVTFYNGKHLVYAEHDNYHLVDHTDENTTSITLTVPDFPWNKLTFNLGVDSATNTSGAMGGDLDPGKGMYWAWQSGYINFKLEGRSSICPTRKNEFAFHLGGYMAPGYAMQTIILPATDTAQVDIAVNLERFIGNINLSTQNSVMIPGPEAVELSKKAAEIFQPLQP